MRDSTLTRLVKLFVGVVVAMILMLAAFGIGVNVGSVQTRTALAAVQVPAAEDIACQPAPTMQVEQPPAPVVTPTPAKATPRTVDATESPLDLALFNEAWKMLEEQFYGDLPQGEEVTYAAIRGVVESLGDKHTTFLTPKQAEMFNSDIQGQFEGIGARVDTAEEGGVEIKYLFADQPAQKAGIEVGDVIVTVDGQDVTEMDLNDAISLIRGPRDTEVLLGIRRGNEPVLEIKVTRARIEIPVVETKTLADGKVEYIALSEFSSVAPKRLAEALKTAVSRKPMGIILDLRGNPGGLLDASVQIGSYFVPEGNILIERFKDQPEQDYARQGRFLLGDIPLAVLVDGGSASASEIVAGVIQDAGTGKLIGETTYGKGSVQLPNALSDGSQLRVTIARWFTPKDRAIHETGLTPDIETLPLTKEDIAANRDPQLDRAVEYLLTGK